MKYIFLIGLVFHLIYLYSIFDIYFKSPIIHGMEQFESKFPSPSKRLVFIVSDGLRQDKLFENLKEYAPFLNSIIQSKQSSFGISHTRVPTESRPCHIAMFAGIYEDVSSIFTGWKVNPVSFDSTFNQSSFVLQIGSPDVVRIFKGENIESHYYPEEMEDFSKESKILDEWVFHKFSELINHPKLKQDKVIIFLHLLGMDSIGHIFKPNSEEYLKGIQFVDKGVEGVYNLMKKEFPDDLTSFIFTSDHGMSNRGSHGDGEIECTQTPFIGFGNGFQYQHKDIFQADICPLISSLIGLKYSMNNIGTLPTKFLNGSEEWKFDSLLMNTKQIYNQFLKKRDLKKNEKFFFTDYKIEWNLELEKLLKEKKYQEFEKEALKFIENCKIGLNYFQKYDWFLLMTIIVFGYIGWIFNSFHQDIYFDIYSILVYIPISFYLYLQGASILYYFYLIFPILFLRKIKWISEWSFKELLILELVVVSYFYREAFSLYLVLHSQLNIFYLFTSIFTLLPVNLTNNQLVILGGILIIIYYLPKKNDKISLLQYFIIIISIVNIYYIDYYISMKESLNYSIYLSWIIFIISLIIPIFVNEPLNIFFSFSSCLILLSVSYEILFYFCLFQILMIHKKEPVDFIILFNLSFFGCGNLASFSSFELSSVYRFVTIFSPFLMASLLIIKLMIPMLTVVILFKDVNLFKVLSFSDILTLNFFFLVKDTGSWLEIGNSISRFAICNGQIIIQYILFSISNLYLKK